MVWLNKIARKEILKLKAYSSARGEFSGDVNGESQIQLDANENPYSPYAAPMDSLNRYPEPQPVKLKEKLAQIYRVTPPQLLITRGMDEGIDLLIKSFCSPTKDAINISTPTFGFYRVSADINSVETIETPLLDDFDINLAEIKKLPANCKVVFLCSPNNPTGKLISLSDIEAICQTYNEEKIIAVDEAYLEFSEATSATTLLDKYSNLVVMKTLSKAYGLAGLRIGTMIANPQIIALLKKVLPPYPIPAPCAKITLESLSPIGLLDTKGKIEEIVEQRGFLYEKLSKSNLFAKVYDSQANFILVIAKDAQKTYIDLKSSGVIIRDRKNDISSALRITVGSKEENITLLRNLGILTSTQDYSIRQSTKNRKTNETEILCTVKLDGKGNSNISTGLNFFNHMLDQIARHSGISLNIQAVGDTDIDCHHTIEDVAIVLGQALREALGDKRGVNRYGFMLPMDEAEATVSLDLSGRAYCVFDYPYENQVIGDISSEMIKHFFETLSSNLQATVHLKVTGFNNHHMVEALFKAFAKTLKDAVTVTSNQLPSTKGAM